MYFGDSKPAGAQPAGKSKSYVPSGGTEELPENVDPFSEVGEENGELPF